MRTRPNRLPRGYTTCIIVRVYIPEWNQPSKQNALKHQVICAIEPAIADSSTNGKLLILIGGDVNGADVSPLLRAYQLKQINIKQTRINYTIFY